MAKAKAKAPSSPRKAQVGTPTEARENAARSNERPQGSTGRNSVIWLPDLRGQEITDGRIDEFARFIGPGHVLVGLHADNSRTREAHMAREALKQLQCVRDAKGRLLRVSTVRNAGKTRVTSPDFLGAYINCYVCNGTVLVLQFGDRRAHDSAAGVLDDLYPGRKIVQLDVDRIHEDGGGTHCTI